MTTGGSRPPPGRLPTLTEVVSVDEVVAPVPPSAVVAASVAPVPVAPVAPVAVVSPAEAFSAASGPHAAPLEAVTQVPPPEPSVSSAPASSLSPSSFPSPSSAASTALAAPAVEASAPEAVESFWPEPGSPQAEQLVDEVLDNVQRRIDLLFEYRVREALVPALGRAAELLVRESRDTLAEMLRDVVGKAVAQELAARRRREP